uniref:Interleukin-4 n=1 Tax=Jaculus jaculus TaxID=51337 RepID=A0A8C5KGF6_JACJA
MGLAPQLVATLLCLLVCPGNSVRGCNRVLGEIVQTLTSLLEEKTPCTEMTVAPILTDSKRNCPVNESTQRTLKNFLENLKAIMQKKYSQ